MKLLSCFLVALWSVHAVGQVSSRQTGTANRWIAGSNHPLRLCQGKIYDLSGAAKWLQNAPPDTPPDVPRESPFYTEWQQRLRAWEVEGQKWQQYILDGSVAQHREEGLVIDKSFRKSETVDVLTGSQRTGGHMIVPTYKKETRYRTISKQVLLKNAPPGATLPILAIPVGTSVVGPAVLETFDYGRALSEQEMRDLRARWSAAAPVTASRTNPPAAVRSTESNPTNQGTRPPGNPPTEQPARSAGAKP